MSLFSFPHYSPPPYGVSSLSVCGASLGKHVAAESLTSTSRWQRKGSWHVPDSANSAGQRGLCWGTWPDAASLGRAQVRLWLGQDPQPAPDLVPHIKIEGVPSPHAASYGLLSWPGWVCGHRWCRGTRESWLTGLWRSALENSGGNRGSCEAAVAALALTVPSRWHPLVYHRPLAGYLYSPSLLPPVLLPRALPSSVFLLHPFHLLLSSDFLCFAPHTLSYSPHDLHPSHSPHSRSALHSYWLSQARARSPHRYCCL